MDTVGDLLKTFRLRAMLSQEELSQRSGISVRAITDVERGRRKRPHRHTLDALAGALVLSGAERDAFTRRALLRLAPAPPAPPLVLGREREFALAEARLADPGVHLLTLAGAGGIGKTTLGTALLAAVAERFPGGAGAVWLDQLADPRLVPAAAAAALGIPTGPRLPPLEAIASHLGGGRALLLLDNTEHLLPGVAGVAAALLKAAPGLVILTTGREPLHLPGEWQLTLDALPVPGPGERSAAALATSPAVQLFLARANRAGLHPGDAGDADDALLAVADICRTLDGMPLAIELAAGLCNHLAPVFLRDLLHGAVVPAIADPARIARHQSMRENIAWSYERLTATQQALFRALSACPAGFGLAMAGTLAEAPGGPAATLADLLSLLDKHLIVPEDGDSGGGEPRFRMLRPIREEAARLRDEAGESGLMFDRHAGETAREAASLGLALDGPHPEAAMRRFPARSGDLRAALSRETSLGRRESLLPLATGLGRLLVVTGGYDEAAQVAADTADALDRQGWHGLPDADILRFHSFAAHAMVRGGRADEAGSHVLRLRRLGPEPGREAGTRAGYAGLAESLGSLVVGYAGSDPGEAIDACRRAIPLLEIYGDSHLLARTLTFLAFPLTETGRLDEAAAAMERSLAIRRAANSTLDTPYLMAPLALIRAAAGRPREAADLLLQAADLAVAHRDPGGIGLCVSYAGIAALHAQPSADAARACLALIGAAEAIALGRGLRYGAPWNEQRRQAVARAADILSPGAAADALRAGAALDIDAALATAEERLRDLTGADRDPDPAAG